jgi:hypothetical protein
VLNLGVPSDFYECSPREFPEKIPPCEYGDLKKRIVKSTGYMTIDGFGFYLSEAFGGLTVALEKTDEGIYNIVYRGFALASVNVRERASSYRCRRKLAF